MFSRRGNFFQAGSFAGDDVQLTFSSSNRTEHDMSAIRSPRGRIVNALSVCNLPPLFAIRTDAA
jgi:hypothetical protein